ELEFTRNPSGAVQGEGRWIISLSGLDATALYAGEFGELPGESGYDWLGAFASIGGDWIHHPEHGYLYLHAESGGSLFLWDLTLGWLWTAEDLYPRLYRYDPAGWLYYYSGGTPDGRHFYDFTSGEHFVVP